MKNDYTKHSYIFLKCIFCQTTLVLSRTTKTQKYLNQLSFSRVLESLTQLQFIFIYMDRFKKTKADEYKPRNYKYKYKYFELYLCMLSLVILNDKKPVFLRWAKMRVFILTLCSHTFTHTCTHCSTHPSSIYRFLSAQNMCTHAIPVSVSYRDSRVRARVQTLFFRSSGMNCFYLSCSGFSSRAHFMWYILRLELDLNMLRNIKTQHHMCTRISCTHIVQILFIFSIFGVFICLC